MDWAPHLAEIDAFLSDEKIRRDVHETVVEARGRRLEVDGKVVVFPPDMEVRIEEKMLVRAPGVRGGGYLLVKTRLLPAEAARNERGDAPILGVYKIMYDLQGACIDDFWTWF